MIIILIILIYDNNIIKITPFISFMERGSCSLKGCNRAASGSIWFNMTKDLLLFCPKHIQMISGEKITKEGEKKEEEDQSELIKKLMDRVESLEEDLRANYINNYTPSRGHGGY